MNKRNHLLAGWEAVKDKIPSDHADAAEALWDYGDLLADQIERDKREIERLREALARLYDEFGCSDDECDICTPARAALRNTETRHDD